ncbi:MAG: toprim domain-containing protein [Desulfobacterales bacterium]
MSKPLVIVESPTKQRSLKIPMGTVHKVTSTVGHIKDLPEKRSALTWNHDFAPKYVTIKGKQKVIKSLKARPVIQMIFIWLPDPDREGEAIAYHTADVLKKGPPVSTGFCFMNHQCNQKPWPCPRI